MEPSPHSERAAEALATAWDCLGGPYSRDGEGLSELPHACHRFTTTDLEAIELRARPRPAQGFILFSTWWLFLDLAEPFKVVNF